MVVRRPARFEGGPAAGVIMDLPPTRNGEWPQSLDPVDVVGPVTLAAEGPEPTGRYELVSGGGESDIVYRFHEDGRT